MNLSGLKKKKIDVHLNVLNETMRQYGISKIYL